MSFLRKLFGGGSPKAAPLPRQGEAEHYKECRLVPEPIAEGGQYRLAGWIEDEAGAGSHHLVRADLLPTFEDACSAFLRKARRVIDEQGADLFRSS